MSETPSAPLPPKRRRFFGFLALLALLAAVVIGREFYQRYTHVHIRTDDAYVQGTIHTIASRIPGTVVAVAVADNQEVRAGQTLVEIDPDVSRERVKEAEAALQAETLRGDEIEAQRSGARMRIRAAEAALARVLAAREELAAAVAVREAEVRSRRVLLEQAQSDYARAAGLVAKELLPREREENARTARESAATALVAAEEIKHQAEVSLASHASAITQAREAVEVEKAALAQAEAAGRTHAEQVRARAAQADVARLTLGYTRITSPADGRVTRKSVETGNQIQAGQPLLAIVSARDLYLVANYKETQLHSIYPGLPVRFTVDAVPGREFKGRVDSIMAGTGSAFSLFPPENASGNYVKVVQRIPVKIAIDPGQDAERLLRVGMSVVPTVLVGH